MINFYFMFLPILTFVFLLLNIAYFLSRSWENSFYPISYSSIYFPKDRPVVRKWKVVPEGIKAVMRWNAPVKGWQILKDGEPHSENSGPDPIFKLPREDTEKHEFTVIPQPESLFRPMKFTIRFLTREFHVGRKLPRGDCYIITTDEPNGEFKQYSVDEFADSYDWLSQEELAEVDTLIQEKIGIEESDTIFQKIEKLMIFLREEIGQEGRGTPEPFFRPLNPYEIFKTMRDGKGVGWCTQQGQMFSFFANRLGLKTRLVQGARTQGNTFLFSGHTWNECWIPEQGRWAWVDPSPAVCYATDKKGQVLNTVELARLRQHDAWDGVNFRTYKDWQFPDIAGEDRTVVDSPFEPVAEVVQRQFVTGAIYKWRRPPHVEDLRYNYGDLFKNWTFTWGNFVRYWFKPPLAYADYPTEGRQTYWIRHILLWGFVLSLVGTLVL